MVRGLAFCTDVNNRVILTKDVNREFNRQLFYEKCKEINNGDDVIVYVVTEFGICMDECYMRCYLTDPYACKVECFNTCKDKLGG